MTSGTGGSALLMHWWRIRLDDASIRSNVWRWLAISAGAASAVLASVVRRGSWRLRTSASSPTEAAATEAALPIARGAISDEGGSSRMGGSGV